MFVPCKSCQENKYAWARCYEPWHCHPAHSSCKILPDDQACAAMTSPILLATNSLTPSEPRKRTQMGPSLGSKTNSKVKNGQQLRSARVNSSSLLAIAALPQKRNA